MKRQTTIKRNTGALAIAAACGMAAWAVPVDAAWQPTRTMTFVVPAGTGGGADQMAREIQGVAQKQQLL
jgi:putative tricarboxylic transport membrane protein